MVEFPCVDIRFIQNRRLRRRTNESARNIFHTNIMYLKASTGIKISTCLEQNGGMRLWITKWTFNVNFPSLLCRWRAKFECWILYFFVHGGQAFLATISLPFPHQTMLRGVTCALATWSRSTLYKGGRGMISIDGGKVSQHFFQWLQLHFSIKNTRI